MTSQGSPYGRLRRALDRRNLLAARSAAAELGEVGLVEALELLLLIADQEPARLGQAAVRWHARYCRQAGDIDVGEAQAVLGVLVMLGGPRHETAVRALGQLLDRHGLERAAVVLATAG